MVLLILIFFFEALSEQIKKHPKVFTDDLKGNTMKMELVKVKFKPDAVKPKVAYSAREPSLETNSQDPHPGLTKTRDHRRSERAR